MIFAIAFFFAQAYSCGSYGAGSYSQCPVVSSQTTTSSNVSQPTTPSATSTTPSSEAPSPTPTTTTPSTSTQTQPHAAVVGVDYAVILGIAFCLALFATTLLWLLRFWLAKRREKEKQKNRPTWNQ